MKLANRKKPKQGIAKVSLAANGVPAHKTAIQTIAGQLRLDLLKRGRIVQIGLGGIGQILSRYLTLFLSSLKDHEFRVLYVDGDAFEPDNSYRMDVPDFLNKAEATCRALEERFGRPGLHLRWVPEYVTPKNIRRIIGEGDFVLAGLDNHKSRLLLSRRLRKLKNGVLISGGNDGVEPDTSQRGTYGNVQVYVRVRGTDLTPPLERFHPEIATPADKSPAELDCLELAGAGAPQLGFANLAVASAMCNAVLRLVMPGKERVYDEVCFDVFEGVSSPHWLLGK
jgi:ThiF family